MLLTEEKSTPGSEEFTSPEIKNLATEHPLHTVPITPSAAQNSQWPTRSRWWPGNWSRRDQNAAKKWAALALLIILGAFIGTAALASVSTYATLLGGFTLPALAITVGIPLAIGLVGFIFGARGGLESGRTNWCHVYSDLPTITKILSGYDPNSEAQGNLLLQFCESFLAAGDPNTADGRRVNKQNWPGAENQFNADGCSIERYANKLKRAEALIGDEYLEMEQILKRLKSSQALLTPLLVLYWDKHPTAKKTIGMISFGGLGILAILSPMLVGNLSNLNTALTNYISMETIAFAGILSATALAVSAMVLLNKWLAGVPGQHLYKDYATFKDLDPTIQSQLGNEAVVNYKSQLTIESRNFSAATLQSNNAPLTAGQAVKNYFTELATTLSAPFAHPQRFWRASAASDKAKYMLNLFVLALIVTLLAVSAFSPLTLGLSLALWFGGQLVRRAVQNYGDYQANTIIAPALSGIQTMPNEQKTGPENPRPRALSRSQVLIDLQTGAVEIKENKRGDESSTSPLSSPSPMAGIIGSPELPPQNLNSSFDKVSEEKITQQPPEQILDITHRRGYKIGDRRGSCLLPMPDRESDEEESNEVVAGEDSQLLQGSPSKTGMFKKVQEGKASRIDETDELLDNASNPSSFSSGNQGL